MGSFLLSAPCILDQAREILAPLEVPLKQQNDMCCYVLLAMSNITEEDEWQAAINNRIRIHDVIQFTGENFSVVYV